MIIIVIFRSDITRLIACIILRRGDHYDIIQLITSISISAVIDKNSIRCYCDVAHVISTNYKTAFNKYDSVLREAAPRRALYT